MSPRSVVVVGASLAGATAALELRSLGHTGPVTLVGAEEHLPYERPGLSKDYLAGTLPQAKLLMHERAHYDEAGIDLVLGLPAVQLDVEGKRVLLEGGQAVPYDVAVLATGSDNLRPPIPGIDLPGVHQLRTIDDADVLRDAAARAKKAVVVGTGFIGCEVASTLAGLGLSVTAVDVLPGPLWAQLGPTYSGLVRSWMESSGVRLITGVGAAAFLGADQVEQVQLQDGQLLDADLVVVGVGVRPAAGWLADSGLTQVKGAVAVDAHGRTSATDVYAAGDLATMLLPGATEHRHVEHWSSAIEQGKRVAQSVTGAPEADRPMPVSWFWSDQYGHNLQYAGQHAPEDELVVRGELAVGFFLQRGVLGAVAAVDSGRDFRRAMALIGQRVDPTALVDPAVDLRKLLG